MRLKTISPLSYARVTNPVEAHPGLVDGIGYIGTVRLGLIDTSGVTITAREIRVKPSLYKTFISQPQAVAYIP